ncbi:hypothetical protein FE257_009112 [Aspergillus nanangensis]|uniref:Uncharacterized protein n=1 Tax=Aspergillus nanangensis TaxID=2582783 RepID=A0AAD4CWQ9_ASPNN|nr:hypothetical protein FE257_009112 [Aspergillus nanangensis]
MEVPADISFRTIKGSWTMDNVSDDMDPIMKLQGVGWLTRKGIGAATLTLHASTAETTSSSGSPALNFILRQTLTGGIPGATEERIMDWTERERINHIYGNTLSRSQLVSGIKDADGAVRPELTLQSKPKSPEVEAELKEFLVGGTPYLAGDDVKELYVHDFGRNEASGWTAEQIWAFELIDSKPYLTRRVVVVKGDEHAKARLVFKLTGQ